MSVDAIGIADDKVPEKYRGFFDNADWTLHQLVVAGSRVFLVGAIAIHFFVLTALH